MPRRKLFLANKNRFLGWWYFSTSLLGCFCEIMAIDGVFVCVFCHENGQAIFPHMGEKQVGSVLFHQ